MLTEEETNPMPVRILDWVMQGMHKMKCQGPCLGQGEKQMESKTTMTKEEITR